ncbi:ABC transporter substrate-binding protein [Ammoniphilus sp. YIM 78166]|uniref:ABC transporter substrate-binding protein n=1 Tax=Ammoniphilus sp. YIM 78166 TaxID=1644106 RepID=UPI00106FFD33|nr:sugar ABC transporter substrate-binding protein [Ammoniphilus sp. YIM 78166]
MKALKYRGISKMLVAAMVSMLALTGCGSSNESAPSNAANSTEATKGSQEEVVLKIWVAANILEGPDSPGMKIITDFNEKYKGQIRVEGTYAPWETHNTAIQAAFASGDVPDLFQLPVGATVSRYVSSDLIQPISGLVSDEWKKVFAEGSFQEGVNQLNGEIYTWPMDGPSMSYMLYYNKDVLKNAGLDPNNPPKSWDELREMAKTVTSKGNGDIYGVAFPGGALPRFTQNTVAGFAIGAAPGSNPFGFNYQTGKYDIDSKAWVDSVNFLLDLKKDGSILPSSFALKVQEAQVLFAEGKIAFLLDGRWAMSNIKKSHPNAQFGMSHIPTPDGSMPVYPYTLALNERGIVVSKTTKHPEAVAKFIEEGIGSEAFYKYNLQAGTSLTPIPKVNEDKSNYPYPEMEQFEQVHSNVLRLAPDVLVRNPEQTAVYSEIGALEQSKLKPSSAEIFKMLLNETEKDVQGKLKETADKMNKQLAEGIDKVKGKGSNVTLDDYVFPNWNPSQDYLKKDYESIKK